ncbi:hypothetical protein [Methylobacterium sp. Leaf111]|nr:hypothetical protein [Methylobacterium sp. Leaf111]
MLLRGLLALDAEQLCRFMMGDQDISPDPHNLDVTALDRVPQRGQ